MRFLKIIGAAGAMLTAGLLHAQSVKSGIDAWQRSDYPAAVSIWRPLAEKGDADASFNLGQAYRLGRGVETNLGAAQTWFERAARKGHVDAQTTLGLMLFQNGNQTGGLRWLRQGAEQGDPRALLVYGTALFNGDGIARDPILGYAYVSRAAAQGLAPAKQTLTQLDEILPLEQRKKGLAIAMAKAKAVPPPSAQRSMPVKASAAKPPPSVSPKKAGTTGASSVSGSWRIQLGAFAQRSSAEALYRKVAGNGALNGRSAYYIPVGAVTRLQIGPFPSRAAAQSACASLKGQACFAVAGK